MIPWVGWGVGDIGGTQGVITQILHQGHVALMTCDLLTCTRAVPGLPAITPNPSTYYVRGIKESLTKTGSVLKDGAGPFVCDPGLGEGFFNNGCS